MNNVFYTRIVLHVMVIIFIPDDLTTKVVSEVDVRKVAHDIEGCRVFNTTLANPSAVQNVFIDGMFQCNYYYDGKMYLASHF